MLNKIVIHGHLGGDPELKEYTTKRGEQGYYVRFSVGVNQDMSDDTDWFSVVMFGNRAKVVEKFFSKGSQIIVYGRMESSTKTENGKSRKYWQLTADGFDFCDSKDSPRGSTNVERQQRNPDPAPDIPDGFERMADDVPF